jgi:hypothetical protein
VPTVSTKTHASVDASDTNGHVELARRRIDDRFYDRPEVRRTVVALLLKELTRPPRPAGSSHPETA